VSITASAPWREPPWDVRYQEDGRQRRRTFPTRALALESNVSSVGLGGCFETAGWRAEARRSNPRHSSTAGSRPSGAHAPRGRRPDHRAASGRL
jgi:hypothetical protein